VYVKEYTVNNTLPSPFVFRQWQQL